jgi:hypothetical protein
MITAGTKLRFRDGDGGIVTGLAGASVGGQVTIETLEDPPRRFTRSEHEVVVIGDESVFGPVPGVER